MPNPWDIGSARLLVQLGFPALATTSAGLAWSLGRADNRVSLGEVLTHLRDVVPSVDVPVNADFEAGFATMPDAVGANVAAAAATGVAGLSIEDSTGDAANPLFEFELAVERIRAARHAIDAGGTGALLTGRSEGFLVGRADPAETIRRLAAYAEAGADCLYAPGLRSMADIAALVKAVAPKPVNVLAGSDFATVAELALAGVRRISVGGALARAAWTGFLQASKEIAEQGTFTNLGRAVPFTFLNGSFAAHEVRHLSTEELLAGLDAIRRSPKSQGVLDLIVRRPAVGRREVLHEGRLDPTEGLVGDTWKMRASTRTPDKRPHADMQLNIMNSRAIALIAQHQHRWPLAGDQLFIDLDLSDANLPAGTQLALGSAVIEVTGQPHTGCKKFVERFGLDAVTFVNSAVGKELHLRGINARVVRPGVIRAGDAVRTIR